MKYSPIVIFVYNRPEHTRKTLESLLKNPEVLQSQIFVYADGAKDDSAINSVGKTRDVVKEVLVDQNYELFEREQNFGLARNIKEGVSEVINKFGTVIVIEDDLLLSHLFLRFMNQSLEVYKNSPNVYSVNAYMHPIPFERNEIFLSPLATSSWGWATWSDKWSVFSMETPDKEIIQSNIYIKSSFNIGDLPYHEYLDNDTSWAIRWYYSVFIRNGLGVFPTKTLVKNIGFDGTGTNCGTLQQVDTSFAKSLPSIVKLDTINIQNEALLQGYFSGSSHASGVKSFVRKIKKIVKKII